MKKLVVIEERSSGIYYSIIVAYYCFPFLILLLINVGLFFVKHRLLLLPGVRLRVGRFNGSSERVHDKG